MYIYVNIYACTYMYIYVHIYIYISYISYIYINYVTSWVLKKRELPQWDVSTMYQSNKRMNMFTVNCSPKKT